MFAAADPPEDNYHHTTERHKIAPNPYFGEEYVIDLSEVWALLPDFRLHFAVSCSLTTHAPTHAHVCTRPW